MFVIAFNRILWLMMTVVLLLLLVTFLQEVNCLKTTTLSQRERISILRQELKNEIRNVAGVALSGDTSQEEQDYELSQKLPITPIMEVENEKRYHVLRTTTVKTVTKAKQVSVKLERNVKNDKNVTNPQHDARNRTSNLRSKNGTKLRKLKKNRNRKPIEIFYRRLYNKELINQNLDWIHCQDMVSPFLTGVKKNITNPKRLYSKDATVQRVLQLLRVNTTSYGRDDIYSVLYQISTLRLRLFQWDVVPLNMLLNVIIKEHKHTFSYLKAGVRELFNNWRMDISNTTNLLKQTRIFRPPCIQISVFDGSTKAPKNTQFTKAQTTACDEDDDCAD